MKWMGLLLAGIFFLASCGSDKEPGKGEKESSRLEMKEAEMEKPKEEKPKEEKPSEEDVLKVLIGEEIQEIIDRVKDLPAVPVEEGEVGVIETKFGEMVIRFFTDVAPNTCANFKKLANAGFYNGVKFHRVIPDFVVQGGCIRTRDNDPQNDGQGGPGYTIKGELNDMEHKRGRLSMAHSGHPDSGGSQFFICLSRQRTKHLDRKHTVFGEIIEGMDVVDRIVALFRGGQAPSDPPVMMRVYTRKKKE